MGPDCNGIQNGFHPSESAIANIPKHNSMINFSVHAVEADPQSPMRKLLDDRPPPNGELALYTHSQTMGRFPEAASYLKPPDQVKRFYDQVSPAKNDGDPAMTLISYARQKLCI